MSPKRCASWSPLPSCGLAFWLAAVLALCLHASADEPTMKTYTFKPLDDQTNGVQADVHRLPGNAIRPVVIFIHGGALMMGDRRLTAKPGSLLRTLLEAGYTVV